MFDSICTLDGERINITTSIVKIDRERRIVNGFATVEVIDKQDDIVLKAASVEAFQTFVGNIREQHDPHKAVGRMLSFQEDRVIDKATGVPHDGIFVSVYISKGAQDTWEKVLDKTLKGFSIRGKVIESDEVYDEQRGKSVRVIKKYSISELSLVDNPANQLSNIVSIVKSSDGAIEFEKGMAPDTENVFWCDGDSLIALRTEDTATCGFCKKDMTNIGFVEAADPDKAEIVKRFINKPVKEENNMAEQEVTKSESEELPAVEPSADAVEVADEFAKEFTGLSEGLTAGIATLAETIKSITGTVDELLKAVSAVREGVNTELAKMADSLGAVEDRVGKVEDSTAIRKSGDLGEVVQEKEIRKSESIWGGSFLVADL